MARGITLHMSVDDKKIREAISKAPIEMVNTLNSSLRRVAMTTQRSFRTHLPIGATGQARRSVQYKFHNALSVSVEPLAKHAKYVEYGTKPHWTSVKNLERWAKQKGINPYAVQRSIAKHGTKPQPYIDKVYTEARAYAERDMSRSVEQTVERILT